MTKSSNSDPIQFKETEKLILYEETIKKAKLVYRKHKDDEKEELVLIYKVEPKKITFYLESEFITKIILEDYSTVEDVPRFINQFGYGFEQRQLNNFFRFKIEEGVSKIIISGVKKSGIKGTTITINQEELESLIARLNQEQRACNDTKNILIGNFLNERYPKLSFEYKETNNNKELILSNLNDKLMNQLNAEEVELLGKFYVEAASKYSRPDVVRRMVKSLQKSSQILTLTEILRKYEKLLSENPSESEWQKFFNEYITLFDSRYIQRLDQRNIGLGTIKLPDLVLVDIYGYIDFYELKKSGTGILQYDSSHKTYFWSKEISRSISQVADYLHKARENGTGFTKAIQEETQDAGRNGLKVNIISPRAIIVASTSKEFNTDKKMNQYKNLRESLKVIEFVLYDELLDRLKNLLSAIK